MCIHGNSSTRNNNTCKRHTWRATHIPMHTTGTQVRACVSATGFQYGIRIMRGRDERAWFLLVHTHSTGMRAMLEKSEYESIHSRERTNERSLYEFSSSWNVEDVGRYFNLLCRQPRSIPSEKIEFFSLWRNQTHQFWYGRGKKFLTKFILRRIIIIHGIFDKKSEILWKWTQTIWKVNKLKKFFLNINSGILLREEKKQKIRWKLKFDEKIPKFLWNKKWSF